MINRHAKMFIIISLFLIIGISLFLYFQKPEKKTTVAYGFSTKDSEIEAVAEAVSMIKTKLPNPDYLILFSTVGYDSEVVLREVNKLLPNTKVYGGTSMLAVITKNGWHQGSKASLAMLAISSPKITFGVGGANIDDYPSAKEAGKAAIQNAIRNAGKEGEYPQLVLITSSPGSEEEVIEGIEEVIGWGIPIIGGSSGDNDLSGKWKQFANDKVYSKGISLTAIFTDLKIGYFYEAGYETKKENGTITKAKGRVIYEINNRPAAEVYNEWCNGCVAEKVETGGMVLTEATFWPFAKIIKTERGIYYLSIHPLSINATDKSISVFANVNTGDEILLMHGDWQLLLNRAKTTPQKALNSKNIGKNEAIFAIYTFCAGTINAIPPEERPKIPLFVSETIGEDVPFIGTFTFGEQGPLGVRNHHGNLINSIVLFSEKGS